MNSSVRWLSIAAVAVLTSASRCLAADAPAGHDSTATPPPASAPAATTAPAPLAAPASTTPAEPRRGDRPGYGGVGGQFGVGDVRAAGDYSEFSQVRMSFSANWRYTFANSWRWQVSPGFVWTGYAKTSNPAPFKDLNFPTDPYKDDYLTLILPMSFQIQWLHRGRSLTWHVGAGPGAYRVWVENHRKVVRDPVTLDLHRGTYFGGSAEVGMEHFFKGLEATSFEVTLDAHYVNAKRDDQFPSGFNDHVVAMGLRMGANYYFNLKGQAKKSAALPGIAK
jgi:hypothetical protein